MYTKIGLSALAIAGLTLGAVRMLTSAGGASPADCRAPSSGVSAPAGTAAGNDTTSVSNPTKHTDKKKSAKTKPTIGKPGSGTTRLRPRLRRSSPPDRRRGPEGTATTATC